MRFNVVTEAVPAQDSGTQKKRRQRVARVLLADGALASRLALKAILSAAGYSVSGAATAAEALGKLDEREYQLVLADLRAESEEAGPRLLAYARQKEFRPATALIASDISETGNSARDGGSHHRTVHISNENVYYLLDQVAALISRRADRRIRTALLKAS
jgi:CheY-like chemotaxis protein